MKLCSPSLVLCLCAAGCFDLASLTDGTRPHGSGNPDLATATTNDLAVMRGADDLAVPIDLEEPPDLAKPIVHDLAGACALPSDEGKVCDPATSPCKTDGLCHNYVCQPQGNANSGTVCKKASNACHTDGLCDGNGACGPEGTRKDGYNYDGGNSLARCCGGNPTTVNTAQNCGACGIDCNGGSCETAHGGHLYCTCSSNAQCWSKCCSTYYGNPWVCAAGNCNTNQMISCPGNATNSDNPSGPFYCHY
jgi:hypothetical protein